MTPDFALSLSHDGIDLLNRAQRGWRRIGHAKLDSPTFDADLAVMLQKGRDLAPDGLTTKLVIPPDQIKYTAIDSTQTTQSDIDAVLEGATPYALEALVVDCERFGGRTHIAAVAKETLAEAEGFAQAHGFNPVAFVAVPPPFTFQKEVFFGPTSIMPSILGDQATVTADTLPVMIVGTRIKSRLLIMGDITPDPDETIADLFAKKPAPQVQETPAPQPAASVVHVDGIPPEFWPQPQAAEPVVHPNVVAHTPVLAVLPLLDTVIPEAYPRPVTRATLARIVPTTGAPLPKAAAPIAPKRAQAQPAKPAARKPWALAAGIVLAGAVGAIAWTQMNGAKPDGAVATASSVPEPALSEPEPPATQVATLASPAVPQAPDATPGQTQAPAMTARPMSIVESAPDTAPQLPQPPPAPPVATQQQAQVNTAMPSPAQAAEIYAATGVWQRAPRFVDVPSGVGVVGFTAPAVPAAPDRVLPLQVALQAAPGPVLGFTAPANPPAPGVTFERDANGFIAATPEGTLTPEGAVVFSGAPDVAFTLRPTLSAADLARMALLAPAPEGVVIVAGAPENAPPLRPDDLAIPEPEEPVTDVAATPDAPLGGVGLSSLEVQNDGTLARDSGVIEANAESDLRPRLRPTELATEVNLETPDVTDILTEIAAADATLRFDNSTALAVRASLRPALRPSGFSDIVIAAIAQQAPSRPAPSAAAPAPVAAAAPVPPRNQGPVPGGVARAATQEDVIRLRDMNLIGVYGRPNARRALVRLSNGRYVRVEVGSALDGGQVTAIGDDALNYVKRGRTYAVELPGG